MPSQTPPHSQSLRKGRVSEPGRLYLLTSATHQRRPLFRDWQAGRALVAEIQQAVASRRVGSLAWVIMPDHFHWLLELKEASLDALMRTLKSRSAIAINRHLGEDGQIWQKGYHDHALRAEEDVQGVARYIIANPLRAGLVKRIGDYPFWDAKWL
ncbi:MAG: REP-associated tyrosine transposase [Pseudomonadota bacterium]|uniref:REP-associated tyrosine transposase n=1 Tax=Thermithiobacillus tepidarius TaxID=929 RepID=UPI0003FDA396|nr:transposase [Thermithiobacillus tepidarius]